MICTRRKYQVVSVTCQWESRNLICFLFSFRSLCAFLNSDKCGTVYLGIRKDGIVAGLKIDRKQVQMNDSAVIIVLNFSLVTSPVAREKFLHQIFSICFCNSSQSWPYLFLLGCFSSLCEILFYFNVNTNCILQIVTECVMNSSKKFDKRVFSPCNFITVEVSEDISSIPFPVMARFSCSHHCIRHIPCRSMLQIDCCCG